MVTFNGGGGGPSTFWSSIIQVKGDPRQASNCGKRELGNARQGQRGNARQGLHERGGGARTYSYTEQLFFCNDFCKVFLISNEMEAYRFTLVLTDSLIDQFA